MRLMSLLGRSHFIETESPTFGVRDWSATITRLGGYHDESRFRFINCARHFRGRDPRRCFEPRASDRCGQASDPPAEHIPWRRLPILSTIHSGLSLALQLLRQPRDAFGNAPRLIELCRQSGTSPIGKPSDQSRASQISMSKPSRRALPGHIGKLPEELRRSLTSDQGKEMHAHKRFTVVTNVRVYFCDPRSP